MKLIIQVEEWHPQLDQVFSRGVSMDMIEARTLGGEILMSQIESLAKEIVEKMKNPTRNPINGEPA